MEKNHTSELGSELQRLRVIATDRRGGSEVTVEAETGVTQPHVKECRKPPEAGGSKK